MRAPFFSNPRILWEPIPALRSCGLCYGETKCHDGVASRWQREDRDLSPESKALTQEPVFICFSWLHSPLHGWSPSIIRIGTSGLTVTAFHFLSFLSASQTTHSWEKDHGLATFAQRQRHMEKLHSQHKICYFSVGIGIKSFSGVYFTHICFLACPVTFCASWSKALSLSFLNHWEHSRKIIGVIHGDTRSPVGSGTRGVVKRCSWV